MYKDKKILLSKRGYIFWLEHSRVKSENNTLVYLKAENGIFKSFNIPFMNTSILMLGEGCSITRDAVSFLSDSGTLLMFVGGGGTPLHASSDLAFNIISPSSEYRPTQYMQQWIMIFIDESKRLEASKHFMNLRIQNIVAFYAKLDFIREMGISISEDSSKILELKEKIKNSTNTNELLLHEAWFTKYLYGLFAKVINLSSFTREQGKNSNENDIDIINSYLDHGNYLMYGLASVTLHGLGISYALPLLHGKTRRGALVFDVADLVKDALCLPFAFYSGINGYDAREFRQKLIGLVHKEKVLDLLFLQVKETTEKDFNV